MHTLSCAACAFTKLSALTLTFAPSCQTVTVHAAAVSAEGVLTVSSYSASGPSPRRGADDLLLAGVDVTATPALETLTDAARRTTRGYRVTIDTVAPSFAVNPAAVVVSVALGPAPYYTSIALVPIESPTQLVSSLAGLLGLLGLFAVAFMALEQCAPSRARALRLQKATAEWGAKHARLQRTTAEWGTSLARPSAALFARRLPQGGDGAEDLADGGPLGGVILRGGSGSGSGSSSGSAAGAGAGAGAVAAGDDKPIAAPTDTRLAALQADLRRARADVDDTREELAATRAELAALRNAVDFLRGGSNGTGAATIRNPIRVVSNTRA